MQDGPLKDGCPAWPPYTKDLPMIYVKLTNNQVNFPRFILPKPDKLAVLPEGFTCSLISFQPIGPVTRWGRVKLTDAKCWVTELKNKSLYQEAPKLVGRMILETNSFSNLIMNSSPLVEQTLCSVTCPITPQGEDSTCFTNGGTKVGKQRGRTGTQALTVAPTLPASALRSPCHGRELSGEALRSALDATSSSIGKHCRSKGRSRQPHDLVAVGSLVDQTLQYRTPARR